MKPETLAELWRLIDAWAGDADGSLPAERINAILSRHVEQPDADIATRAGFSHLAAALAIEDARYPHAKHDEVITEAARAYLAHLRTVEQPVETEEQAARIVELERRVAELQATLEDEYNISATAEETDNAD